MLILVCQTRPDCRRLAWLKAGFRHCFVVQRVDANWVACDPLADGIRLHLAPMVPARVLAASLAALGATVLVGAGPVTSGALPWLRPATCVEVCKRLLGVRGTWIATPNQLFRSLQRSWRGKLDIQNL